MTPPNADPRDNPSAPRPPPTEPLRRIWQGLSLVIVVALVGLITAGVITLEQLTYIGATAASVLLIVGGLLERARSFMNSPQTSAHNAELRDALAQAIVLAEKNGTVPPVGKTLAEQVIVGTIKGAATPALQAAALAMGLPHAFVVAAAPAALQAAMDAVEHLAARAPTQLESDLEAGKL